MIQALRRAAVATVARAAGTCVGALGVCIAAIRFDSVPAFWAGLVLLAVACSALLYAMMPRRRKAAAPVAVAGLLVLALGAWFLGLGPRGEPGWAAARPEKSYGASLVGTSGDVTVLDTAGPRGTAGLGVSGVDTGTGRVLWHVEGGARAMAADSVVVIDRDGRVAGLSARTGRTLWVSAVHADADDTVRAAGTDVVLEHDAAAASEVVALDTATGRRLWRLGRASIRDVEDHSSAGPVVLLDRDSPSRCEARSVTDGRLLRRLDPRRAWALAGDEAVDADDGIWIGRPLTRGAASWTATFQSAVLPDPLHNTPLGKAMVSGPVRDAPVVQALDLTTGDVKAVVVPQQGRARAVDGSGAAYLIHDKDGYAVWRPGSGPVRLDVGIASDLDADAEPSLAVDGRDFAVWWVREDALGRRFTELVVGYDGHQHRLRWGRTGQVFLGDGFVRLADSEGTLLRFVPVS